jgi:hypothetical protein
MKPSDTPLSTPFYTGTIVVIRRAFLEQTLPYGHNARMRAYYDAGGAKAQTLNGAGTLAATFSAVDGIGNKS